MSLLDTLPEPAEVADLIESAKRERSLLRRLYQLSVEAKAMRAAKPRNDKNHPGSKWQEVTRG